MSKKSVYVVANPDKPRAAETLEVLCAWIQSRAKLAGSEPTCNPTGLVQARPDLVVVLGGDGTMIGVARAMGQSQIPMVGVNFGKLGYLARFTVDELKTHFDDILSDPAWTREQMMLEVNVDSPARPGRPEASRPQHARPCAAFASRAMNDCVIHAGPPFRMIRLALYVDDTLLTSVAGDGLIVATPGGSTAHNMSAGGPILQPGLDAIVITPICPHSLTFRPIVVEGHCEIRVVATEVNEGTTAIVDGQVSTPLTAGDTVTIRRSNEPIKLVRNRTNPPWHTLLTKLHWGSGPGAMDAKKPADG